MAVSNIGHDRPIPIAPAPPGTVSTDSNTVGQVMMFACLTCANRKIKCDKAAPICSSCRKGGIRCIYQAPPPRKRRRKLSDDATERFALYERILRQHNLLPSDEDQTPSNEPSVPEPVSLRLLDSATSRTGKLLSGHGKSRYVSSSLWRNLGDDEMQHMSEEEDDAPGIVLSDPLTSAFMGYHQSLLQYHPTHTEALELWKTHRENVEPICKILHIPSASKMVEAVTEQPELASKSDECMLFAIYHFAVFSMTEEECAAKFGHPRGTLLQIYNFATRQALVNASFLKTTEMSILQALVLFLIPCRYSYDAHTYWVLTGVAVRIAQRMGLHRDGLELGLPPFDVQMRRRVFYQLIPLDGIASQISGTGIALDSWDTKQPLNVNDDQIWSDMKETPVEQNSATDMIFCLARYSIGKYFAKPQESMHATKSWPFKNYIDAESTIAEAESEVEEKYIRYCDIVNPLHFLTICQARSAISAMRLRVRLPNVRNETATDSERKEIFHLAQKIIDTDITACANPSLRKYHWHVRSFFAWGSWDSLIFTLISLRRSDLLTHAETDAAWTKVEQVYGNRAELLESKRALHVAVGRLAVKAWDASPGKSNATQPAFIVTLRSRQEMRRQSRSERQDIAAPGLDATTSSASSLGPSPSSDANALHGPIFGDIGIDISSDFNVDSANWMFWDSLIRDYQSQGVQQ